MDLIIRDYPAYLDEFSGLAALAPAEAVKAVTLLHDHEVAIIEMARAELSGRGDLARSLDIYLTSLADGNARGHHDT